MKFAYKRCVNAAFEDLCNLYEVFFKDHNLFVIMYIDDSNIYYRKNFLFHC